MSTSKGKILLLFSLTLCVACVSTKKYARMETQYKLCQQDSLKLATSGAEMKDVVRTLTLTSLKLGQDSLRLYNQYSILQEKYDKDIEESRQEIVRLNSQLYGNKPKSYNSYSGDNSAVRVMSQVMQSVTRLSSEIKTVLTRYPDETYNVDNKSLEITLTLRDTLLFEPIIVGNKVAYDHARLTNRGRWLLAHLGNMVVEKDNFDVIVKEFIYINTPDLRYIPPFRDKDEHIVLPAMTPFNEKELRDEIKQVEYRSAEREKDTVLPTNTSSANSYNIAIQQVDTIKAAVNKEYNNLVRLSRLRAEQEERIRFLYGVADRSSVIMKTLMRQCYSNLGSSRIAREVSYVKSDEADRANQYTNNDWVVIVLKLRLPELEELMKKSESVRQR